MHMPFMDIAGRSGKSPVREIKDHQPKSKKWVLVMDDDAIMRHVICSMLESFGYRSYGVENGDEALTSYQKAKECGYGFDAVIMDLHIPQGKGGRETVRELLALDPDARVIITTGDVTDAVLINFGTFGFSGALTKPFTLQQLDKAVQAVLKDKRKSGHEKYSHC
jgi:CheY-like chemotaxis protein